MEENADYIENEFETEEDTQGQEILEGIADGYAMRKETVHRLNEEIVSQFGEELSFNNLGLDVIDTNPNILPPLPPPQQLIAAQILNINQAMLPYINAFIQSGYQYIPSLPRMYHLTNPIAGTIRSQLHPTQGWNPSYAPKASFDLALAKAVSVGALDVYSSGGGTIDYNTVILEYRTPLMTSDHKAEAVLNYFLSYKLMYEFSSANSGHASLEFNMGDKITEWDKNGNEVTGNSTMGSVSYIEKFKLFNRPATSPAKYSKAQVGNMKLHSFKFDAKKDHYYKIHIDIYAYAWLHYAKGAIQVDYQSLGQYNA